MSATTAAAVRPTEDPQAEIDRLNRRLKRIEDNIRSSVKYYHSYRNDSARRALEDALELFGDFDQ